jgi:hypothetical protein
VLGTDNKTAIETLKSDLVKLGQQIALSILKSAKEMKAKRGSRRFSITLHWTAGHAGIAGNVQADKEAKKATRGTTSDKKLLPPLLRHKLTTNPLALKKNHSTTILKKWSANWKSAPRGVRFAALDNTTPSSNFLNIISHSKLSRKDSSILTQICTGHFPLNSYLHKFKLVDSLRCPACGPDAGQQQRQFITFYSLAHHTLMKDGRSSRSAKES